MSAVWAYLADTLIWLLSCPWAAPLVVAAAVVTVAVAVRRRWGC